MFTKKRTILTLAFMLMSIMLAQGVHNFFMTSQACFAQCLSVSGQVTAIIPN
ncbi:MAG: hypothetical protein ACYCZH_03325 [Sulfuriferula sp.]